MHSENTEFIFFLLTGRGEGEKYFKTSINRNVSVERRLFTMRRLSNSHYFLPKTINPKSLLPSVIRGGIIPLFLVPFRI